MSSDIQKLLCDPFPAEDVEWRVQRSGWSGQSKPYCIVIPYITARAVQKRLDDVFGFDGWKNQYVQTSSGWLCGISAFIGGEWITKWDGSEETQIEALKGGLSGAMKRAAVQWGIGRYLYSLTETQFALCKPCDNRFQATGNYIDIKIKGGNSRKGAEWFPPSLPAWALPSFEAEQIVELMKACETLEELKEHYQDAHHYASNFKRDDLMERFVKVKDEVKKQIIDRQHEEAERNSASVKNWLEQKITDEISESPNESTLAARQDALKKQLGTRCRGDLYTSLLSRLNAASKQRFNELQKGEAA